MSKGHSNTALSLATLLPLEVIQQRCEVDANFKRTCEFTIGAFYKSLFYGVGHGPEVIKQNMQAKGASFAKTAKTIYQDKGSSGFSRGGLSTCVKAAAKGGMTTLGVVEFAKGFGDKLSPEMKEKCPQLGFIIASVVIATLDTMFYPLDRYKTHIATSSEKKQPWFAISRSMLNTGKTHGAGALFTDAYRGARINLADKVLHGVMYHVMDQEIKRYLKDSRGDDKMSAGEKAAETCVIGGVTATVCSPFHAMRTVTTQHKSPVDGSFSSAASHIVRTQGMQAFWRGFSVSLFHSVFGAGLYMASLSTVKMLEGGHIARLESSRQEDQAKGR